MRPPVDLVWPPRLALPARPPALVYLDLNHWKYLWLARSGRAGAPAGYDALLAVAESAVADGRAVFPLSEVHYLEMSGIGDATQRDGMAALMLELSQTRVLLARTVIVRLEIAAMLDVLRAEVTPGEQISLLGDNALWAFGKRGGFTIVGPSGEDQAEALREAMGAAEFDAMKARWKAETEYRLLAGPSDDEAGRLRRETAYRPEAAHEVTEKRAQQEREQAARLDAEPKWRIGRLRDVIAARETALEWIGAIADALRACGTSIDESIGADRETMRWFADGMPSSRVAITLKTRYHRDGRHRWTPNDINDIDALATAVAYCDAVFTDKAAWNALNGSSEIKTLGTVLPRRPHELVSYLEGLSTSAV